MKLDGYFLPRDYVSREEPSYFDDETGECLWQPDVYSDVATLARRCHAARLIDIGCGDARKLAGLHPEFELVGLDFGKNLEVARAAHPFVRLFEHDLDTDAPPPIPEDLFFKSVIICSDVIEHLRHPEYLLRELSRVLPRVEAIVLSTPERELTHGRTHRGPPANPCHVREWTREEFGQLIRAAGFEHAEVGLTRSNDRDARLRTILAIAFPRRSMFGTLHARR
jgi:SAM-dependent methyltransferase